MCLNIGKAKRSEFTSLVEKFLQAKANQANG